MSNYLKLRALAEQLVAITDQLGNDESNSELGDTWSLANDHYVEASESAAVLALISENERLKVVAQKEIDATCESAREVAGARMTLHALQQERDQLKTESAGLKTGYEAYEQVVQGLKAEVEALRREREGKVLCDLELFETLRDSANTEADEHRQCMATYRPLRQANLDSVVKKCDDLLAALGQGEQS